jgi:hypothetical protein
VSETEATDLIPSIGDLIQIPKMTLTALASAAMVSRRVLLAAPLIVGLFALVLSSAAMASSSKSDPELWGKVSLAQIAEVKELQTQLGNQGTLSYSAKWNYHYKGVSATFSIEQAPPWSRFVAANGAWDETNGGQDYFFCAPGSGCPRAGQVDPLFQRRNLFVGVEMSDELGGFNTTPSNAPTGFSLKFSNVRFADVNSTCVSFYYERSLSQEWCIAKNGIITYGKYAGRLLELTAFGTDVNASTLKISASARKVAI